MTSKKSKAKKEVATSRVRLYPSTYKFLKIKSVKEGRPIAAIIDERFSTPAHH